MKKANIILLCLLLLFLTACSVPKNSDSMRLGENNSDERRLIDSGDYFKLYDDTLSETYEIYNSQGELVRTETTDDPISITMLNESILDISICKGTGITQHTYYDAEQNTFSTKFSYVICTDGELIAYIGLSEDGADNKSLIVQNIFNKEVYYKEFKGAFDEVDTYELASVDGEFSKDLSTFTVHYYQNNRQNQLTKDFEL